MSGVRAPHLQRRDGVFYLRLRVPDALKLRVGKTEIVRSLRTYSIRIARSRAAFLTVLVMEAFEVIKNNEMTPHEAAQIVQKCFSDLIVQQEADGGFLPKTDDLDLELAEQRGFASGRVADLQLQRESGNFDPGVMSLARAMTVKSGFNPNGVSAARNADLWDGIARALIEQQRLFMLRLDDRLAQFVPTDALFAGAGSLLGSLPSFQSAASFKGPTLGAAVNSYLAAQEKAWVRKTYKQRLWQMGYLVDFLGADRPVASITPSDIREFRDAVITLRANHGAAPSQTFLQKQTDNPKVRIKPKTADLIFQPTKTFFAWCVSTEGLIEISPAQAIKMVMPKKKKEERSRRPFEPDEIHQLFSCPVFTGCKSLHRRYLAGDKVIRDAKFWLPILGYYTGCRLGELVQLAIEDVRTSESVTFLDVNEKELIGDDEKSVKSVSGFRRVPIHPDLIDLGFLDFVAKRAKQDKGNVRLFREMKFGVDGQASTEYSKIFARMMDIVGLTDSRLVFHSWRHGVEDALREAGFQPYVIDAIVGHADQSMGGKYGKGVSLSVLSEAVAAMKLPITLKGIIPTS